MATEIKRAAVLVDSVCTTRYAVVRYDEVGGTVVHARG